MVDEQDDGEGFRLVAESWKVREYAETTDSSLIYMADALVGVLKYWILADHFHRYPKMCLLAQRCGFNYFWLGHTREFFVTASTALKCFCPF